MSDTHDPFSFDAEYGDPDFVRSARDPNRSPQPGEEWECNGRASDIPIEPGDEPSPFADLPPEEFPDINDVPPEDEPYSDSDIDARKATVTFITDETGAEIRRVDMTLPQLAEHIRFQTAASKMALPWLKLAIFGNRRSEKNSLRTNENVLQITGIEVEHDAGEIAFGTALATILRAGIRCILYTSPSNVPGVKERWRILVPLSQNREPEVREKFVARVNGLFGGNLAPESFVLSQGFLYGSVNNNPNHRVEVVDGQFLDRRDDLYAGSIFKDGSKVGAQGGPGVDLNGAGRQHRSRKDDDPKPVDRDKIEAALNVVSSDCNYKTVWMPIGGALYYALGDSGFELFDRWSAKARARYNADECRESWRGFRSLREYTTATIFHFADQADPTWTRKGSAPLRAWLRGQALRTVPAARVPEPAAQEPAAQEPRAEPARAQALHRHSRR
jgi:Primase C terminal 2 (PriCT-2)